MICMDTRREMQVCSILLVILDWTLMHLYLMGSLCLIQSGWHVQITMPKDNMHFGSVEHRDLHNQNGQLFHLATAMVCRFTSILCLDCSSGLLLPEV